MSKHALILGLATLFFTPFCVALAQQAPQYVPIAQIPFAPEGTITAQQFVENAYRLAIVVAAMLAVIKIIYGGVQYMLTDVITNKGKAVDDIKGAIFGLIIVLTAVFILEIINPKLKEFNLFSNAPAINVTSGGGTSAVTTTNNNTETTGGGVQNSGGGAAGNADTQAGECGALGTC